MRAPDVVHNRARHRKTQADPEVDRRNWSVNCGGCSQQRAAVILPFSSFVLLVCSSKIGVVDGIVIPSRVCSVLDEHGTTGAAKVITSVSFFFFLFLFSG